MKKAVTKKWYESKTIIIGAIGVVVAGLEAYDKGLDWPAVALAVLGAAMIFLRTVSDKPIQK